MAKNRSRFGKNYLFLPEGVENEIGKERESMTDQAKPSNINRRDFLRWVGVSAGSGVLTGGISCRLLEPIEGEDNPLSRSVSRDWEKIYHDQYRYDRTFDWVCSPNDTHACRVRAYVRNGIVIRSGSTYDYQNYADLYGNHATVNWNPRQCAKG